VNKHLTPFHDSELARFLLTDQYPADQNDATEERERALALFPRGSLVVLVGPAGSGKSQLARAFPHKSVVSLDDLRERLTGHPRAHHVSPQASRIQLQFVRHRMEHGLTTIVDDNIHVDDRVRASLLKHALAHERPLTAVVFLTSLDVCLARNGRLPRRLRERPEEVRRQHERTALHLPLLTAEGFTEVRTLAVDPL